MTIDPANTIQEGPEVSLDALVGRSVDGRFRVVRMIGRGGMGSVFEVERGTDRVALKVLTREAKSLDAKALKRFEREATLASEINHPHVTRTLEFGRDPELGPFLVMELLCGQDLAAVIDEAAPLAPEVAARVGAQAARGLAAAHALGIVHRDVKPQNLFLHRVDDEVRVKVCDFGIAKLSDQTRGEDVSSLTNTGGLIGSPRYMSPEQAQGAKVLDVRTDVWSLCASLHEALSGHWLWPVETLGELIVAICTKPVPSLAHAAPWVPSKLADAVERGLSRDRGARWNDMNALEAALSPFTSGSTVVHVRDLRRVPAAARAPHSTDKYVATHSDTTHAATAMSREQARAPAFGLTATEKARPLATVTPLAWIHRDEVAQIAHADGVMLSRLSANPSETALGAFRAGLDTAIGVAGERTVLVHIAVAGAPRMDRSRLVVGIKQILRDYDGRIGGGCMIVLSSSEFLSALLRSMGTAALLALRLRTRAIFILGDTKEAAQRLAPIRGVPVAALHHIIDGFEAEARQFVETSS